MQDICELLAQEGDLVGHLMEEIVTRAFPPRPSLAASEPAWHQESQSPSATRLAS